MASSALADITGMTTSPAGGNTHIQFNKRRAFGADPAFTYSTATKTMDVSTITAQKIIVSTLTVSTLTVSNLDPGVMMIVGTSSQIVTNAVSLSTQIFGTLPIGNLTVGASTYIQNTNTLQTGAVFNVSSGTIANNLAIGTTYTPDRLTIVNTTNNQIRLGDTDVANYYGFIKYDDGGNPKLSIGNSDVAGEIEFLKNGTTPVLKISGGGSAAGYVTQPLQPSFLVTDGTGASNVTGDSTVYTKLWPTEIYDQGSNFSSNTFTAPVTGRYFLSATVSVAGMLVTHTGRALKIVTSNRNYTNDYNVSLAETDRTMTVNCIADMDAGDTATVTLDVSGSTKVVDILNSGTLNYFSGSLIN